MDTSRRKILLVEDHEDTRELLALVLGPNYDVSTAATFAAGLILAETCTFDLFLLDSRLPDGAGTELCTRIRKLNRSTPIVFCSGRAYESDKREALNAGAQVYLVKPIDVSLLCGLVDELISVRPTHRPFGSKNTSGEAVVQQ